MKKLLSLISCILFLSVSALYGQDIYRVVNCKSHISIREYKSTKAPVLATVKLNEEVIVYNVEKEWATVKYDGKDAYVLTKYLRYRTTVQERERDLKFDKIESYFDSLGDTTWMLWVIVPLIVGIYFFVNDDNSFSWTKLRVLAFLLFTLSLFEFGYTGGSQEFSWFCSDPEWYWIAVNFLIFGACAVLQLNSYITYTSVLSDGKVKIGLYSWIVVVIVAIILEICDYPAELSIIIALVAQVIQLGIIVFSMKGCCNWLEIILYCLVYLTATLATLIVLVQFLALLIIVLIGLFVLRALASGSSSSSSSSSASSDSDNSNESERLETEDGVALHYDGFGKYHDDWGREYENTDYWGGREMRRTK